MNKIILEELLRQYEVIFGEQEPYITDFFVTTDIEEAIKAVRWCVENKKTIRFYPQADKVLKKGYMPNRDIWDIF